MSASPASISMPSSRSSEVGAPEDGGSSGFSTCSHSSAAGSSVVGAGAVVAEEVEGSSEGLGGKIFLGNEGG